MSGRATRTDILLGTKWPSRLPNDYLDKTLAALVPPASVIASLPSDRLRILQQEIEDLRTYITSDPLRYFIPSEGGQWDFMTTWDAPNSGIRVNAFFAGNKSGKTTGSVILAAEMMEGRGLWTAGGRRQPRQATKVPSRGVFFAEDFSSQDEVILSHYFTWVPKAAIKRIVRNAQGYIVLIEHKNGSVAHLRTYDQGYSKPEGKDYDWIGFDEPPPRDIYTAAMRGTVATGGVLWIAATLLKEQWLYDELDHPFVRGHSASSYDNHWVDQRALSDFDATLTPEERTIRIFGRPTSLSGVIYPEFKQEPPFVVDDLETWDPLTQEAWPVVMGVDPHERKPLHVLWAYLSPFDTLVFFDYALIESGPLEGIFKKLKEKELSHDAPTRLCIMDPNRGLASQMGGSSWAAEFEEHGYDVLLGNDDMRMGHSTVRDYLRLGANGQPGIVFLDACRGKGGPIHQLSRYAWEDWSRGMKMERDLKEKPRDKNKDFPDIVRYVCMALHEGQISYDMFQHGYNAVLDVFGQKPVGRPY